MQVGALAMCCVEANLDCGEGSCWLGGRRLAASADALWRDGAVDVLSVACAPGSGGSPLCESEEGVMYALHNKVCGHY